MLSFFAIAYLVLPFASSTKIHDDMSPDEIRKTFRNNQASVPDYELVRVYHTLDKQNVENEVKPAIKINAFQRKIDTYLTPIDGLLASPSTPVWIAEPDIESPENIKYIVVPNAFAKVGTGYQDNSTLSAIVAYTGEDGEILIHGTLHSNYVIHPIPHRLNEKLSRETRSVDDRPSNFKNGRDKHFRQSHHHVVYKRTQPDTIDTIKTIKRDWENKNLSHGRSKRSLPDIIYPEILVIIDNTLTAVISDDIEEVVRYVFALWNAVDLRYRLFSEPIVRLNIAGIIISQKKGGTPYLDDHRRGVTQLDADHAISAMSHYFYRDSARFDFDSYDMAVAMTNLDMANVIINDVYDTSTLGYAYEWGACNRSHIDMNTEAVGIVEDNGGYKAILTAAHEVAHLMGAPHDGIAETINCPAFHGFLMSAALNLNPNSFGWSNCSLENIHEYLRSDLAPCLFNEPPSRVPLPRILPGKLMTLDEQCEKMLGTRACYHDARVCVKLQCKNPGGYPECSGKTAAAEGSYCGDGFHCINGRCLDENEKYLPYEPSTTMKPFNSGFLRKRIFDWPVRPRGM